MASHDPLPNGSLGAESGTGTWVLEATEQANPLRQTPFLSFCLHASLCPHTHSPELGHSSIHTGWPRLGLAGGRPSPTAHRPKDTLTYSELLPEDGLLAQGGAVPAAESELVLALIDAHLRPLPDHNDRIGSALADGTLPWGQARNLVADDVGSQGHHG